MSDIHKDTNSQYWLSYKYLLEKGVLEYTIAQWSKRDVCERTYIDRRAYINYDTIPEPTRRKLPTKEEIKDEYNHQRFRAREIFFTEELEAIYQSKTVRQWQIKIMDEYKIPMEKALEFGRKAAVIECAINLHQTYHGKGTLEALHRAYLKIYPDGYTKKNRFCMALTQAKTKGILSVAVNGRFLNSGRKKEYKNMHEYFAMDILAHNKGYDINMAYEIFCAACMGKDMKVPGYKWFWTYYRKNKNLINRTRLGTSKSDDKNRIYAKIIPALHAGDQWQVDGWEIPLFCKLPNGKGGFHLFQKLILFAVLDANTRRIVGYSIGLSENTEVILKGLEMAARKTSCIPYEIVSDNHSFNKTKEAGNLKDEMTGLGCTWTVDSNPRRKAILERAFRTLGDKHFKRLYGYIGQGVKTKIENGLTQQELRDIYQKPDNFLTYEQVVASAVYAVETYNDTIIKKLGDTPNNLYERSEKPNAIPVDMFRRMSLFTRKTELKVSHGQITITRAGQTYDYQLPAGYSEKYNNQSVSVCYLDFNQIYLFEKDTNNPICSIPLKAGIHGALANQAETDKALLFKGKGRTKGIKTKGRKKKESLFDEANIIDPGAYEYLNKLTTSKDALQAIRDNAYMQDVIIDEFNLNPTSIKSFPVVDEMLDASLKPPKKDEKSPFQVNNKGVLKKRIINGEGAQSTFNPLH